MGNEGLQRCDVLTIPTLVFLSLSIFMQRVILNQHFTITGIKRDTKSYENAESSRELGRDDW